MITTTLPREVGMLFKAPLVRAIKNTSIESRPVKPVDPTLPIKCVTRRLENRLNISVGNVIWVRESYAMVWPDGCDDGRIYDDSSPGGRPVCDDECRIEYRADVPDGARPGGWPPNMPGGPKWDGYLLKKYARLWLKVVGVIRLPLRDTNDDDAVMEGFKSLGDFAQAWDELAPVGARWFDNPTVWVIEFERIEKPELANLKGTQRYWSATAATVFRKWWRRDDDTAADHAADGARGWSSLDATRRSCRGQASARVVHAIRLRRMWRTIIGSRRAAYSARLHMDRVSGRHTDRGS